MFDILFNLFIIGSYILLLIVGLIYTPIRVLLDIRILILKFKQKRRMKNSNWIHTPIYFEGDELEEGQRIISDPSQLEEKSKDVK